MPRGKAEQSDTKITNGNEANLGFEVQMILAAEPPRTHLNLSDRRHVVLSLRYLKLISHAVATRKLLIDTPVRVRWESNISLRAPINARGTSGLAA